MKEWQFESDKYQWRWNTYYEALHTFYKTNDHKSQELLSHSQKVVDTQLQ